jgi:hypothetical protein
VLHGHRGVGAEAEQRGVLRNESVLPHARDRIRPVEHDDFHALLGRRFHDEAEDVDVLVEPRADLLDVEDDDLHIPEHLGRGLMVLAVEIVLRQPRRAINRGLAVARDRVVVGADVVLHAEQHAHLGLRVAVEGVREVRPVREPAAVIRDERESLAANEVRVFGE